MRPGTSAGRSGAWPPSGTPSLRGCAPVSYRMSTLGHFCTFTSSAPAWSVLGPGLGIGAFHAPHPHEVDWTPARRCGACPALGVLASHVLAARLRARDSALRQVPRWQASCLDGLCRPSERSLVVTRVFPLVSCEVGST